MGKKASLPLPLDVQKLKGFQLQGGFAPLTRGSAPGPRWGLRPHTPVIGSRSALAMSPHLSKPPGSAPAINITNTNTKLRYMNTLRMTIIVALKRHTYQTFQTIACLMARVSPKIVAQIRYRNI